MFLQLLTLGVAIDADSNASKAAKYSKKSLNAALGSKDGTFLTFDELDYGWHWKPSGKWYIPNTETVSTKKYVRHSIPVSRIKEMIESVGLEQNLNYTRFETQWNRISKFHQGPLVLIKTFDGTTYILDGSLVDIHVVKTPI